MSLFCGVSAAKSRVVEHPRTIFYSVIQPLRVETTSEYTVLDVRVRYVPGWWVCLSSQSELRECGGDRTFRLLRAEGYPLDSTYHLPQTTGEIDARLFFEPVPEDVVKVDYMHSGADAGWVRGQIWGLSLQDGCPFPDFARGNWMTTDGKNRWIWGFHDDFAIYDNRFWRYLKIEPSGRKAFRMTLESGGDELALTVRTSGDDGIKVETEGAGAGVYRRGFMETPGTCRWTYDPERYRDKLYEPGKAVLKGYLKGYDPRLGFRTMTFRTEDFADTKNDASHLIEIDENGCFEASVELDVPQKSYLSSKVFSDYVLLIPGDTLLCYYDLGEKMNPREQAIPSDRTRFMGGPGAEYEHARMLAFRSLPGRSEPGIDNIWQYVRQCVEEKQGDRLKEITFDRIGRCRDSLARFFDRYTALSDYTRDLLVTEALYSNYMLLMDFQRHWYLSQYTRPAFFDENGVLKVDWQPLEPEFLDFMTPEWFDNPLSITSSNFSSFVGCFGCSDYLSEWVILQSFCTRSVQELFTEYVRQREQLPPATLDSLEVFRVGLKPFEDSLFMPDIEDVAPEVKKLIDRYGKGFMRERNCLVYDRAADTLRHWGIERSLVFDYALARSLNFRREMCSPEDLLPEVGQALTHVRTPFVAAKIADLYASEKMKAAETSVKPSGLDTDNPCDVAFAEMIAPYAGNVLFIDFWATGCGPCRLGMIRQKPIVEKSKDKKIKFLYVTCESSSPLGAYNKFLSEAGIGGEHIRLDDDRWNMLSAKFGFTAIPYCLIVDKEGNIVETNGNKYMIDELKQKLFELESR